MILFIKKNNRIIKYLIVCVHFVLSFFFEKLIYRSTLSDVIPASQPISDVISRETEKTVNYILIKIVTLVLIYLLWSLVFAIISGKVQRKIVIFYSIVFLAILFYRFELWGFLFNHMAGGDQGYTFAYAVRFEPYYWHHIFTSSLLSAMMSVIPNIFSLAIFQALAVVCTFGYISVHTGLRKTLLLLFLLPYTMPMAVFSYRNCYFAILCMFYTAYLIAGFINREKSHTLKRIIIMLFLSAIISVWRTEGIIFGIIGFFIETVFVQEISFDFIKMKKTLKKVISISLCFVILAVLIFVIGLPQKIDKIRYHRNDYLIVNTFDPLQTILNSEDRNLNYENAAQDLEKIEKICPIENIKAYGLSGYKGYNENFRNELDIMQSFADEKTSNDYLRACFNIYVHNLDIFCLNRIASFLKAIGGPSFTISTPPELETGNMLTYKYNDILNADNSEYPCAEYLNSPKRLTESIFWRIDNFLSNATYRFIFGIGILLLDLLILFLPSKHIKNKKAVLIFKILIFAVCSECIAVITFMPMSFSMYFIPVMMTSIVLQLFYFRYNSIVNNAVKAFES